jgi:hypothetical protein
MLEVLLDFNLVTDLLLHPGLDDLGLVETLEGENVIWLGGPCRRDQTCLCQEGGRCQSR